MSTSFSSADRLDGLEEAHLEIALEELVPTLKEGLHLRQGEMLGERSP